MGIEIIFAPPRRGKTCYMTHKAREYAFNCERNRSMQKEIVLKQASGFEGIKTIPQHCVSANYPMEFHKFGYSVRRNRIINPYRLGYDNPHVRTHFSLPYEVYAITEAQKYLNSRMSLYFPDWQSRWYEQHGHNDLEIMLDTQRPSLIDVNVRDLACFTEIMKLKIKYDDFGKPCRLQWLVRHIPDSWAYESYLKSGKKDKACYDEEVVTADYNVFASYDSQSCKPKFYQGHENADFDYTAAEQTEETMQGYIRYLLQNDDELPEKFYIKKRARE